MATGVSIGPIEGIYPSTTVIAITASGAVSTQVIAGLAGQIIRVYRMELSATASGAANVIVASSGDGGSTNISGPFGIAVNTNLMLPYDGTPWFVGKSGGNLILSQAGIGTIGGTILASQG